MLVASEAVLGACLVMLAVWVFGHLGGLGAQGGPLFNWHPLLMGIAFLGAMTQGVVAFGAGRRPGAGGAPGAGYDRARRKRVHWVLNGAATALALAGAYAAYRFHAEQGIPHVYSVHATLGVAVLALVCAQLGLGFAAFLAASFGLPDVFSPAAKRAMVPVHAVLGLAAYGGGLAAFLTGLMDKQAILNFVQGGDKFAAPSALPNWIALLAALGVLGILAHASALGGIGSGADANSDPDPDEDGTFDAPHEGGGLGPSRDLERVLLVSSSTADP